MTLLSAPAGSQTRGKKTHLLKDTTAGSARTSDKCGLHSNSMQHDPHQSDQFQCVMTAGKKDQVM